VGRAVVLALQGTSLALAMLAVFFLFLIKEAGIVGKDRKH